VLLTTRSCNYLIGLLVIRLLAIRLFTNHSAELNTLAIPTSFHISKFVALRPRLSATCL
jgi:hypothetical protein